MLNSDQTTKATTTAMEHVNVIAQDENKKDKYLCYQILLVILITVVSNLPRLSYQEIPSHDSLQVYNIFFYFYNSIFTDLVIPEWLPYSSYGTQAEGYQLTSIGPMQYVVTVLGMVFRIKDTLLLFKLSVLLEQLLFNLSMFWISVMFYESRATRWLVVLPAILCLDWQSQIWFNFRIYAYIPSIIGCIYKYVKTENRYYFWFSMLITMASLTGNPPYFLPIFIMVIMITLASILINRWISFRSIMKPDLISIIFLVTLLLNAYIYLHVSKNMLNDTVVLSNVGRDQSTGTVSLDSFLTHGGLYDINWIIKNLISGSPVRLGTDKGHFPDLTVYAGYLAFIFGVYSLFIPKKDEQITAIFLWIGLTWFMSAGIFSMWCYFFVPAMNYYRYISFLWSINKVFMLMCSGFGIEHYFKNANLKSTVILLLVYIICIDLLFQRIMTPISIYEFINQITSNYLTLKHYSLILLLLVITFGHAYFKYVKKSYGLASQQQILILSQCLLLAFCLGDTLLHRRFVVAAIKKISLDKNLVYSSLYNTNKLPFTMYKTTIADSYSERAILASFIIQNLIDMGDSQIYDSSYHFVQHDPAGSMYVVHAMNKNLKALLTSGIYCPPIKSLNNESNLKPSALLGCYFTKVHFVDDVLFEKDDQKSLQMMKELNFENTLLINEAVPVDYNINHGEPLSEKSKEIEVKYFDANRLELNVLASDKDRWLVYTDNYTKEWTCTMDGKPTKVYRANLAFKAVQVPKGTTDIRFIYRGGKLFTPCITLAICGLLQGIMIISVVLIESRVVCRSLPGKTVDSNLIYVQASENVAAELNAEQTDHQEVVI